MPNASGIQIQSLLRHAVSMTISEGIINCLIVTDSPEANIQLTRIHEHIFARTYDNPARSTAPLPLL